MMFQAYSILIKETIGLIFLIVCIDHRMNSLIYLFINCYCASLVLLETNLTLHYSSRVISMYYALNPASSLVTVQWVNCLILGCFLFQF